MFTDRRVAGKQLAQDLLILAQSDPVVLALPRGGVPVGFEVAEALGTELDVLIVRKLGVPTSPEYGFGAIGEDGATVINHEVVHSTGMSQADVDRVVAAETAEIGRRSALYRGDHSLPKLPGRTVIIVDDGLATGSTMAAAIAVVKKLGAERIIAAVPVGARDTVARIGASVDQIVCLQTPANFRAVGIHYGHFDQVQDDEVIRLLASSSTVRTAQRTQPPIVGGIDDEVLIPVDSVQLKGNLTVPVASTRVVLFAHGSGSSRLSSRNQYVAKVLNDAGFGTLLFDLLTDQEANDRANVFDIELLATRLAGATEWLLGQPGAESFAISYFGASTGAGAALVAAAQRPDLVSSVVSRGGRPDLAGPSLPLVQAPTLLIVGGSDFQVLELNQAAQRAMRCPCDLQIVPGATHLFEEPGTLQAAAQLAKAHIQATLVPGG
jgi:putative phosphoribosyl transferase